MTSRAGRKNSSPGPGAGFTLVEVVLVVAIIALAAVVFAGGVSQWTRDLTEGTDRVAAAVRMARAEAIRRGRRLCLVLGGFEGEPMRALWEPDPLLEPGVFVPFRKASWIDRLPDDLIEVAGVQYFGRAAYRQVGIPSGPLVLGTVGEGADLLIFDPDGTTDTAVVELAPLDPDDLRRGIVEVDGASGRVETHVFGPSELDRFYDDHEPEGRP